MSKRLTSNINSRYFEAANRLKSKHARRRIVAYVESYDDVFFWRMVLGRFENDKRYFEIMLPDKLNRLERGKKAVIMKLLTDHVGEGMVACVDADYDYLLQGRTHTSEVMLNNPYILHTYAYAIENMMCYAPGLHDVCVAVTLNDSHVFDFEFFLREFSQAIFPLFVWNIWFYRQGLNGVFPMSDFLRVIEMGTFKMGKTEELLHNLRRKVDRKVRLWQADYPEAKQTYLDVKADMRRLGVTADNCYMYIQGHHLFDKVVLPMLRRVCDHLIRLRQNEIVVQSRHATQKRNELQSYSHCVENLIQVLKKNVGFVQSEQFAHIMNDVARIFPSEETFLGHNKNNDEMVKN